jgi:hypothetical protein
MGYREAATHIQLWLLGALVSHLEFDVMDFLICEIENTVLDGLRAHRQLPYAHYLCHIFAQLIRPPQFQGTLEASRLIFGSYRPAPEDPMPAPALVIDTQAEDTTFHQFETQDATVHDDDDDDDDFGVPPPPPMPPRTHDHEAGSSSDVAPAAPPAIDPALAVILQTLTQQQAHLAAIQQQMSERMLSMFQTIQDRQDTLQQQLLQDRAENRAFMTLMLQHTGVLIPPVQSAPPPPLQAPIVPAIQLGPPLPSVGLSSSPLQPVTLVFTSLVISSVSPQPPVPPASAVTTAVVVVSVTSSAPAAPAAQLPSESVPALASTADPGFETDSGPQLAFALLPRPRPDAPSPPPPSSYV